MPTQKLLSGIETWCARLAPEVTYIEIRVGSESDIPLAVVPFRSDDRALAALEVAGAIEAQAEASERKVIARLFACAVGGSPVSRFEVAAMPVMPDDRKALMRLPDATSGGGAVSEQVVRMYAQHAHEAYLMTGDTLVKATQGLTALMDRNEKLFALQSEMMSRLVEREREADKRAEHAAKGQRETEGALEKTTAAVNQLVDDAEARDKREDRQPLVEKIATKAFKEIAASLTRQIEGGA